MKKLFIIMVVVSLALMGCQGGKASEAPKETKAVEQETPKEDTSNDLSAGEKNPVVGITISDFKVKDVDGNDVDASVFTGKKLTVINLWGTFCGPCVEEMPDLQKVAEKYKDKDVQMIGIIGDNPTAADGKAMLDKLKVTYLNLLPDQQLQDQLLSKFDYVPVTIFVDENGKVLDTFIPGATDEKSLSSIIDKLLEQ